MSISGKSAISLFHTTLINTPPIAEQISPASKSLLWTSPCAIISLNLSNAWIALLSPSNMLPSSSLVLSASGILISGKSENNKSADVCAISPASGMCIFTIPFSFLSLDQKALLFLASLLVPHCLCMSLVSPPYQALYSPYLHKSYGTGGNCPNAPPKSYPVYHLRSSPPTFTPKISLVKSY